jgi:hypothetical protein
MALALALSQDSGQAPMPSNKINSSPLSKLEAEALLDNLRLERFQEAPKHGSKTPDFEAAWRNTLPIEFEATRKHLHSADPQS